MDGLPPNSPTPALTLKTPVPGSRAPKLPRLGLSIPPSQGDRATTPGADRPSLLIPQSHARSTTPSLSLQLPPRSSTSTVSADGLSSGLRSLNISTDLGSSSRGESTHNLDSRISIPSSASSTAQSVTSSNGVGAFGGADPSSAISIYSNNASSDKNSALPDLDKLTQSLGRDLDVDDLDDDKWMAASQAGMIEEVATLGEGSSGAVTKCKLKNGKTLFALKIITTDPDPDVQKQIRRELEFNRKIAAQHICKYYGAFGDSSTGIISIAMECCEGGSLDAIYKEVKKYNNRIGEKVLGKIAEGVLHGLTYLYSKKIIHRDIKPSNILLTRSGIVKLCDFGVSGEFGTRGDADTFIGTSYYMAPERITGQSYTITSDVWSLGVTILEVAQNKFPFADGHTVGGNMLDMIQHIVRMPLPKLMDEEGENGEDGIVWSEEFKYFIECCLERDANRRATPWRMLEHPWMEDMQKKKVNMGKFLATVWDWSDKPKESES